MKEQHRAGQRCLAKAAGNRSNGFVVNDFRGTLDDADRRNSDVLCHILQQADRKSGAWERGIVSCGNRRLVGTFIRAPFSLLFKREIEQSPAAYRTSHAAHEIAWPALELPVHKQNFRTI